MAFAIAHCGDSDVRVSTDNGVVPSPGTFSGSLSDGGTITIEAGSIEAVSFTCDDEDIHETFSPPQPVDSDGTFNVKFEDAGRSFRVRGTFRDNNNVDGTIDDEDNECDVSYDATRGGGPLVTATPARTPTGLVTTATPTTDGEPTTGGPTSTDVTNSATPTGPTPTGATPSTSVSPSGPSPSNTPRPCPVAVEVVGNAGSAKVLDSGWSGLGHNATVVSDGKLTFNVTCDGTTRPCGVCDVSGPIQNINADKGDINPRRCSNDTSIKCVDNSACGAGTCAFFFGAPLPLAAGGINTCVVNQIREAVTGTANIESGAFQSTLKLSAKVYNQTESGDPCPKCQNDPTANDGKAQGTCLGGVRNGQACDVNGVSPVPSFGSTSLDCPPAGIISSLSIDLGGSSNVETRTLDAGSPNCLGAQGKKCFCPAAGTEPTKPNACFDEAETPDVDESICAPVSAGSRKGICGLPQEQYCGPLETFRGCLSNTDCTAPGDTCGIVSRPCFLDNGVVGGSVTAQGKADPPDNTGTSNPTFAALFCIPPVAQSAINTAGGLPGLGRIELPLVSKEILVLPTP
jgi:hypothetical protein